MYLDVLMFAFVLKIIEVDFVGLKYRTLSKKGDGGSDYQIDCKKLSEVSSIEN